LSKAFSQLLKDIDNLSHTDKEKVYQWVKRYVQPASTVGGRLIDEMRETRFKEGFECPHCTSGHVFVLVNIVVDNAIVVRLVERHLPTLLIQLFIKLEKETNGLHLLIVCSKAIPCGNLLTL